MRSRRMAIVTFIKQDQELWGVKGMCGLIGKATKKFGGQDWRSESAKSFPEQVYPGHWIGIIGKRRRGKEGYIADFSKEPPIIGEVKNMRDQAAVKAELERVTHYAGWEKKLSHL